MCDSSAGGEPSGCSDLNSLIRKVRHEFSTLNPSDTRWPCPFCFHKSKTVVQCHIHVSKEHPSIYKIRSNCNTAEQDISPTVDKQDSAADAEVNDLDLFLKLINKDKTQGADIIVCQRCTDKEKKCKGFNGLKVHYSRIHKDFMSDFMEQKSNNHTSGVTLNENRPPLQNQNQHEEEVMFKCRVMACSKSFASQNGLKIHIARCHKDSQVDHNENDFAQLIQSYKSGLKVIRRIPRGARISVGMKLSSIVNDCVVTNSEKAWQSLFLFPYHILSVKRTNRKHISLTKTIKQNTLKNVFDLSPEARTNVTIKNVIESKVADGDIRGAIRILSSADSIAIENDTTFQILKEKHPLPLNIADKPNDPIGILPLTVTEEQVKKCIFSFAAGSASGIDGLAPQHLKDLLSLNSGEAASQLLCSITKLSNLMLSGKVCTEFVPYLYGASLIALNKKDGGIRPIAVGATLRRLVSKLCCVNIVDDLVPQLQPKQLGFGVKGGSEAAVHSVRTYIQQSQTAEVIVKVDVGNAFNSMDRTSFLKEIEEKLPGIYPYLHQCASATNLFYNKSIILSATGCQQGDPLGPAIFSLGINDVIQTLASDLNLWYLDDGTLGGIMETVIDDLGILKARFQLLGMNLNTSKFEAFIFSTVSQERKDEIITNLSLAAPGISFVSESNFCLLGAPVLELSIEEAFKEKQLSLEFFLERLLDINPHVALYLLQHSLWIPRLTYLLRCTPLFKFKHLLTNMDDRIRQTLETIINMKFSDQTWLQCTLPVKYGGIGIRSCEDLATPAFLSSIYGTKSLVGSILKSNDLEIAYLDDAFSEWKLLSFLETMPEQPGYQSQWDLPIIERKVDKLPKTSEVDCARLLALSRPESGAWLHALPSKNLGTILDKTSLRIAISLRVGGTICKQFRCVCGSMMNSNGIHGLSCNKSSGRYGRHSALNQIIKRALSSAGFSTILEPPGLIREDGKRADGMTIFPWKRGKSLVWDATCVDTLAQSYLSQTSKESGAAANKAEIKKINLYKAIALNHVFVGFAVETLGPFSDGAKRLVNELGKLLVEASGDARSKSFFIQRIGIEVQRGNAASVIGTIPNADMMEEIFYL